ncbi:MAG: AmmeMemoRadiSam system protein A [Actinomycetota bacterium]
MVKKNLQEEKMDKYVELAKKAVEKYIKVGKVLSHKNILEEFTKEKAGIFVSIKKKGELRGCIGTIYPTKNNVVEEIISNAISSSTRDPRFSPVEKEELKLLTYSVDILSEPEKIEKMSRLNPKKYGVVVKSGHKTGLLLPDLEGVDTPEMQVNIAKSKAGIFPDEEFEIYRFTVTRHK